MWISANHLFESGQVNIKNELGVKINNLIFNRNLVICTKSSSWLHVFFCLGSYGHKPHFVSILCWNHSFDGMLIIQKMFSPLFLNVMICLLFFSTISLSLSLSLSLSVCMCVCERKRNRAYALFLMYYVNEAFCVNWWSKKGRRRRRRRRLNKQTNKQINNSWTKLSIIIIIMSSSFTSSFSPPPPHFPIVSWLFLWFGFVNQA